MLVDKQFQGVLFLLAAVFLFACLELSAKLATATLPPLQVVWSRYIVHAVAMIVFLLPFMGRRLVASRRIGLQTLRSLLLAATTACQFTGLSRLQLAEVTSINFGAPFIVAALSVPLLGERPGIHRWASIIVGFAGVLVIVRPGFGETDWAYYIVLLGAFLFALYVITTRLASAHDSAMVSLFYTALVGAIVLSAIVPFVWVFPPDAMAWGLMLAVGFFGAAGHLLFIHASRLTQSSLLAPFMYVQIVWSVLFGFLVFSDLPDFYTTLGAAIVIASGLYLAWREALAARRRRRAAQAV